MTEHGKGAAAASEQDEEVQPSSAGTIFDKTVFIEATGEISWIAHRGKKPRAQGGSFVPIVDERVLDPAMRPFPLHQEVVTDPPTRMPPPPQELVEAVGALESHDELFRRGLGAIKTAVAQAGAVEEAAIKGASARGKAARPSFSQ